MATPHPRKMLPMLFPPRVLAPQAARTTSSVDTQIGSLKRQTAHYLKRLHS